jgi:hypothetical protein
VKHWSGEGIKLIVGDIDAVNMRVHIRDAEGRSREDAGEQNYEPEYISMLLRGTETAYKAESSGKSAFIPNALVGTI